MRGSSQRSFDAVLARFEPVLQQGSTLIVGTQLHSVVDALDGSGALRRALTDPAREPKDKATLVANLLSNGYDERTIAVVADAAGSRWSSAADLLESLLLLASHAILAEAEHRGELATVGSELFLVSRKLMNFPELRDALVNQQGSSQARYDLVTTVFADKIQPEALVLLQRAAATPRGQHVVTALQRLSALAAQRRDRAVAHVTTSALLPQAQLDRLEGLLERAYGHPIQIEQTLDPAILGGLRIQIGAEVVDSTVLSRLTEVRRNIAS